MLVRQPRDLLAWLDYTRLVEGDTPEQVATFCERSLTPLGNVAAVCVYTEFLPVVVPKLTNTGIKVATVCNFPQGTAPINVVVDKIHDAINEGADEIDVVMPYQQLALGKEQFVFDFVAQCKQACGEQKTLKVIIESGELKTPELIAAAGDIVLGAGGDFIKTSTGKTPVGATLDATRILLTCLQNSNKKAGIKVSGGIKNVATANTYVDLVANEMGWEWLSPETFRIGASSLLDDILNAEQAN